MFGTCGRAGGALGEEKAARLHGRAAGQPAAAAGRLFMASGPDARCCHAVVVVGTGASRSQPLAAWRVCCTGAPQRFPQKAGERGRRKGNRGAVSQGLFGRESSVPRPLRTRAGCGMNSGLPPPPPSQHRGDWLHRPLGTSWLLLSKQRPKAALGTHADSGIAPALEFWNLRGHLWS